MWKVASAKGATFTFIFPKKLAEASILLNPTPIQFNEILPAQNGHSPSLKQPTILLVEDNFEMQSLLKDILEPNYHLILAANGADALETLKQKVVDSIITDVIDAKNGWL